MIRGPLAASGGAPSYEEQAKAMYIHASHKGGMDGIDAEKIAKIVLEASASSSFTGHQRKLNLAVDRRLERLRGAQRRLHSSQRDAARANVARRTAELEATRDLSRVCCVVDFDQFYAAVAIRDDPSLADKPLAVGGALVLTANYMARRWGVRSGMPGFVAKELCRRAPEFGMPRVELTFVSADYSQYAQVAEEALEIYREYDPETSCGMGYDECSLDLTRYLRRRVRLGSHALANFTTGVELDEPCTLRPSQPSQLPSQAKWPPPRVPLLPAEEEAEDSDGEDDWRDSDGEDDGDAVMVAVNDDDDGGGVAGSGAGASGVARHHARRRRSLNVVEEEAAIQGRLAEEVVAEIRERVRLRTRGLTVSAGIATNFTLAKIAADARKPDGQFRVGSSAASILDFLRDLPCRKVPFLGRVAEKICEQCLGARTCGQLLAAAPEAHLLLSPARADALLLAALGWDCAERSPAGHDAVQKGISFSDTFSGSDDPNVLRAMLRRMCEGLSHRMEAAGVRGTKLTVRLKEASFEVRSRRAEGLCNPPIRAVEALYARALPCLERELRIGGGMHAALLSGPATHTNRQLAAQAAAAGGAAKGGSAGVAAAARAAAEWAAGGARGISAAVTSRGFTPLKLRSIGVMLTGLMRDETGAAPRRHGHSNGFVPPSQPFTGFADVRDSRSDGAAAGARWEWCDVHSAQEGEEKDDAEAWLDDDKEAWDEEEPQGAAAAEAPKGTSTAEARMVLDEDVEWGEVEADGLRYEYWDEWHDDEAEYDEHAADDDDDVGRRDAMTSEESPAATRWESAEAAPGAHLRCEVQSERRRNHEASYVLPSLRQRTLDSFVVPAGDGSGGGGDGGSAPRHEAASVHALVEMGFDPSDARAALQRVAGDVERAVAWLLGQ